MVAKSMKYTIMLLLAALLSACAAPDMISESATTSETSTRTPLPPTETPLPPTQTLLPPTETPILPTLTPSVTPTLTATPDVYEIVSFVNRVVNYRLWGSLYEPANPVSPRLAVILAHESGGTQERWRSFAIELYEAGYTALIFDHHGHGSSEGSVSTAIPDDVDAAMDFLASRGHDRIICMGGSMGGMACLIMAVERGMEGVVTLCSPMSGAADRPITGRQLAALTTPKLFMMTELDWVISPYSPFDPNGEEYFQLLEMAAEPKEFIMYPGGAHGASLLFDEENSEDVRARLMAFVENIAMQANE